jgi:hypothetical protein
MKDFEPFEALNFTVPNGSKLPIIRFAYKAVDYSPVNLKRQRRQPEWPASYHDIASEVGHGRPRGLLLTNSSNRTSVHSQPKQEFRMTDDFIILSDAELDQASGGGIPYTPPPPHHTGHDTLGWHQHGSSVSAITPFRDLDFYLGN